MFRIFLPILIFSLSFASVAPAQGLHFETTKEGIVRGLTRSWKPPPQDTRNSMLPQDTLNVPGMRRIIVVKKKDGKDVEEEIVVSEKETAPSVNLKIEFDYDSYTIRSRSYALLNELVQAVTGEALREKVIVIKGHTDSDGSQTYNLKLSLNRALSVKSFLKGAFSIPDDRLRVVGYGEAMPLVSNTTPVNKQINRRVEIRAE